MNWIEKLYNKNFLLAKELDIAVYPRFCQQNEDVFLHIIFENIGKTNNFFVDIGAGDGEHLSNTRLLKLMGWDGLLIDSDSKTDNNIFIYKCFITKENILDVFKWNNIEIEFDLLSIDIDGNDYWILEKILGKYKPRVIIAEFNSMLPVDSSLSIKYDENFVWGRDSYFGFSLNAGKKLAEKFGYSIIFQNNNMNCYFVRNDLIKGLQIPEVTYKQSDYFKISERTDWVEV